MRLSLSKLVAFSFVVLCFGLFAPAAVATVPPVIRANATVKQTSLCYVEMPNVGWQNLDALCFMGKDMSRSRLIDMDTDRNNDGIPDDLATFFQRMDEVKGLPLNASPAEQQAFAAKQRQVLKEFAERAPMDVNVKNAFSQMADMMYEVTESGTSQPSPAQLARWNQRGKSMDQIMDILDRDPFMQKVNEYWKKYEATLPVQ